MRPASRSRPILHVAPAVQRPDARCRPSPGASPVTIARDRRRPRVSRAAHALLPPCCTHGVCPPSLAGARPGGRSRGGAVCPWAICSTLEPENGTVLPSARRRGWEDSQRASACWQEGMGGLGRDATPAAGWARAGRARRGLLACAGLSSRACPPAAVLDARHLSSQPRWRSAGRTVAWGRWLSLGHLLHAGAGERHRPPVRA
jgi:hypothetical protein